MSSGEDQKGIAAVSGSALIRREAMGSTSQSATTLRLLEGARALARATEVRDVAAVVCSAAVDATGCDFAALIERQGEGARLRVRGSSGVELEGDSPPRGAPTAVARAFEEQHPGSLTDPAAIASAGWPFDRIGAGSMLWQPVLGERGPLAAVVAGWRSPRDGAGEQARPSLELLAGEAAVALERAATVEHLLVLSRTDPLTDLSNRRAWQDELAREMARAGRGGQPLSIGLLDLDDLKGFNDRWGHPAGDRLLLTAAARWRRRLRLSDLIARIGGDEFAVTMPGCGIGEAAYLADQLRAALPDGISCSIGVAEWADGESLESLHDRADRALYAAKFDGRDRTMSAPAPGVAHGSVEPAG